MLKRNSINVHSNTQQLVMQIWPLSKMRIGCRIGDFEKFWNGFAKSPLLPWTLVR